MPVNVYIHKTPQGKSMFDTVCALLSERKLAWTNYEDHIAIEASDDEVDELLKEASELI